MNRNPRAEEPVSPETFGPGALLVRLATDGR
jgi:hypothetical protein